MNKEIKREAKDLATACFSDGQVFQSGREELKPRRRVYYEKAIVELLEKATLAERKRCADKIKEYPRWSPESDEELDNLVKSLNQQDKELEV